MKITAINNYTQSHKPVINKINFCANPFLKPVSALNYFNDDAIFSNFHNIKPIIFLDFDGVMSKMTDDATESVIYDEIKYKKLISHAKRKEIPICILTARITNEFDFIFSDNIPKNLNILGLYGNNFKINLKKTQNACDFIEKCKKMSGFDTNVTSNSSNYIVTFNPSGTKFNENHIKPTYFNKGSIIEAFLKIYPEYKPIFFGDSIGKLLPDEFGFKSSVENNGCAVAIIHNDDENISSRDYALKFCNTYANYKLDSYKDVPEILKQIIMASP